MKKLIITVTIIIFGLAFMMCEPNEHEVTVDNRSNTNVLVTFTEGGSPIGSLLVYANSINDKKIEGDGSYSIIVAYAGGTWSTSNSKSDITIIVPTVGKPYKN